MARIIYELPALLGAAEVPAALVVGGDLCASNATLRERLSEDDTLHVLLGRVARGEIPSEVDSSDALERQGLPVALEFSLVRDQRLETDTRQYRVIEFDFPAATSTRLMICRLVKGHIAPVKLIRNKFQLTEQEARVARYVAQGRSNRAIGRELGISERTVRHHLEHVMRKLGAASRTEAAHLIWRISGR